MVATHTKPLVVLFLTGAFTRERISPPNVSVRNRTSPESSDHCPLTSADVIEAWTRVVAAIPRKVDAPMRVPANRISTRRYDSRRAGRKHRA
jgi:hypothetical protein